MASRGKREIPHRRRVSLLPCILLLLLLLAAAGGYLAYNVLYSGGSADSTPQVTHTQEEDVREEAEPDAEEPDAEEEAPAEDTSDEDASEEAEAEEEEEQTDEIITLTISCVGDCTIGSDPSYNQSGRLPSYVEEYGMSYFFSNVVDIFSADDLTIINFEGVLTTSTSRADKTYAFKGDPSYVEILTAGSIEACNLANNHSHDFGSSSYTDTVTYLEEAGLITFGYDTVAVTEVNGVKVGLVGIYELAKHASCSEDLETAMAAVKELGAELIIVTFHWGVETETVPNSIQKSLAHQAVDLGANLVVGHHPHVLQGIETYNGVNICYSLGNFCFGGNRNPSDKDTMIYQQTFTFVNGELQVNLEEDVNIIPCTLSSVSSYNDYRPTVATGDEADRILAKIQTRSDAIG